MAPPRKSPPPPSGDHGKEDRLTSIGAPIHCVATKEPLEDGCELEEIEIDRFITALADIALAIAHRREETEL